MLVRFRRLKTLELNREIVAWVVYLRSEHVLSMTVLHMEKMVTLQQARRQDIGKGILSGPFKVTLLEGDL